MSCPRRSRLSSGKTPPCWPPRRPQKPSPPSNSATRSSNSTISQSGATPTSAYLGNHVDKPLRVVVERKAKPEGNQETEELTIEVAPNPMRWFGLVMEMGPISAIQAHSPAAAAGVEPGGTIRTLDGKPAADPMTLPELFHGLRGRDVVLGVEYPGKGVKEFRLTVGDNGAFTEPLFETNPMTIPSLGIAYRVLNRVRPRRSPARRRRRPASTAATKSSTRSSCPPTPTPSSGSARHFTNRTSTR